MKASLRIIDMQLDDPAKSFEPAGRMASAIIDVTEEKGGCLPQDLGDKGFTPDEIANYWPMAKALATVELKLMRDMPSRSATDLKSCSGRK